MRQHVKRARKLPRKVWFHVSPGGDVWFCDAFYSRKTANKKLRKWTTFSPCGKTITLKKAGWCIAGPFVRR